MVWEDLQRAQDTEVSTRAVNLKGMVTMVLPQLADFGVTSAKVTALQNATTAYMATMVDKETIFAARKSARAELRSLFAAANSILRDEIDSLVESMKMTHPEFYADYWNARAIADLGHRSRPEMPKVPEEPA